MRVAVIGAGGVGGAFGAALAKAGADVSFIARGAHLAAMRTSGLSVLGPRGNVHLAPARATDEPASVGLVDFVLFCVKLWDVETAGAAIRPLVGPNTAIIPLQNGIDASDRLIPILGKEAVMGGVAMISGTIAEPGVIRQTGTFMRLIFGELDGRSSRRGAAFHSLCQSAGFDSVNSNTILTALWEKFVPLATNSSVVALTRLPFGKLRDDPEVFALFEQGVVEVAAVGRSTRRRPAGRYRDQDTRGNTKCTAGIVTLDGRRFVAWKQVGTTLARRKGGSAWSRARHTHTYARCHVRGAETLRERRADLTSANTKSANAKRYCTPLSCARANLRLAPSAPNEASRRTAVHVKGRRTCLGSTENWRVASESPWWPPFVRDHRTVPRVLFVIADPASLVTYPSDIRFLRHRLGGPGLDCGFPLQPNRHRPFSDFSNDCYLVYRQPL